MKGRWSAVMALLLAASEWVSLTATSPNDSRPPINLKIDPLIQPLVERMWQASPTFRRQCRRLAAERDLQVTVSREDQPTRAPFANARTTLSLRGSVPVAAQVYVKPSTNTPELIAHELEHIVEQLDGVNLAAQVGNGAVWKEGTFFETRRSIETGRRVAREMTGGQRNSDAPKSSAVTSFDTLVTLKQVDRDATPSSPRTAHVSADGRYVVFISSARLVEDDRNSFRDVYVTDLTTGRTTLESVGADDAAGNGDSYSADINGDGRYVVFESHAGNLTTPSFSTGTAQIFLRDRIARITRLLTANANGEPANGWSGQPVISVNGTAVAFESTATDLAGIRAAGRPQTVGIYLMSLATGARLRLDTVAGAGSTGSSMSPAIDAAGQHVVFASKADLTCADADECPIETRERNGVSDIYIYDTESGATRRISRNQFGDDANGASYEPAISGDGRVVAFVSEASNLTRESAGRTPQIYRHDLTSGTTTLLSRTVSGHPANGSSLQPALSFDGSTIVFQSLATNLLCEQLKKCPQQLDDINLLWDVFAFDVRTNRLARLSADGIDEWMENSRGPSIDSAGRIVAFGSRHPIDVSDTAHDEDLFVVRLEPARLLSAR